MHLVCSLALLVPQATLIDVHQQPPSIAADSAPQDFARLGSKVYFAAEVAGLGRELCAWDGATLEIVADILPGSPGSAPEDLTAIGGYLWFSAHTPDTNRELWRSDGTAAGTELVMDLVPGPNQPGNPHGFVPLGSQVVFLARTPTYGNGVWITDGTAAGTQPLVSFGDGAAIGIGEHPIDPTPVGSLVFFDTFFAGGGLWRTDGTVAGTFDVTPSTLVTTGQLTELGGMAYFLGYDYTQFDVELWRSDGTGVEAVATPVPGEASDPTSLVAFGGELYFDARNAALEQVLYKSDGTPGNVTEVVNPAPGTTAFLSNFVAAQTYLAFTVDEPATGQEFWRTDGTTAGTQPMAEAVPGPGELGISLVTALGDRILFRGVGSQGAEPYVADGFQVQPLGDLLSPGGSDPGAFFVDGAEALFAATTAATGREIWRTDGTPAGTQLEVDVLPTPTTDSSTPFDMVRVGSLAFFTADDGVHGREVWVSDGTVAGTQLLVDALPGPASSEPTDLVALGDRLYFIATEVEHPLTDKIEIWSSDGTPAGTAPMTDLAAIGFYFPENLESVGGRLYFQANDLNVYGWEPFSSDGTPGSLVSLGNLNPNPVSKDAQAEEFTAVGDLVYFRARNGALESRLWRTDGTPAGTSVVDGSSPTPVLSPYEITPLSDGLAVFRGFGTGVSTEVWVTGGSGTTLLADIAPGTIPSNPSGFSVVGDRAIFTAENAAQGEELWVTDGTPAGTQLCFETAPGPVDGNPTIIGVVGDRVLFRATQSFTYDLWATDGTPEGTEILLDVADVLFAFGVGTTGVRAGDYFYFTVAPQYQQQEVWRTDGTPAGTVQIDTLAPQYSIELGAAIGGGEEVLSRAGGAAGTEVWLTRGTAASTTLVADVAPGPAGSFPSGFLRVGDRVLFTAREHDTGTELYSLPFALTEGWVTETYGSGCAGSGGDVPAIVPSGDAQLGETLTVGLEGAFGPSTAFLYVSLERAELPVGPCLQWVAPPLTLLGATPTDVTGAGAVDAPLPAGATELVALPLYLQYAVLDPGGPVLGVVTLSDALEVIVGPAN